MSHNDQHNLDHSEPNRAATALPGGEGSVAAQWEQQLKRAVDQLPVPRPPPLEPGWQQLRQALRARRRRRQQYPVWAAAAVLLLAFGVWRLWPPSALPDAGEIMTTPAAGAPRYAANGVAQAGSGQTGEHQLGAPQTDGQHISAVPAQELAALMDLSRQLENEWQYLRQRQRALSGAEMERQMQLAGLIASVDAKLTAQAADDHSDSERQRSLWRQRVVLMNELVAGEVQAEPAVWTL